MKFKLGGARMGVLTELLTELGWEKTTGDDWNLFWGKNLPDTPPAPGLRTACNHLGGFRWLANKISLGRVLAHAHNRALAAGDAERWRFFPRTFEMPRQTADFEAAAAASPGVTWIAKPASESGGKGQYLFTDPAGAPRRPGWLVQEYLGRAHLLGGRKYTLRVYLLVSSLDPLVVHLHRDGLVKRMSLHHSDAPGDRTNPLFHLSNSGVQRRAPGGLVPRLQFEDYRRLLESEGADWEALWARIRRVCTLMVLAGREKMLGGRALRAPPGATLFNLLGPDILIDEHLDPWIIECNGNPGMKVTSEPGMPGAHEEHRLKRDLVEDALRLTGVLDPAGTPDPAPLRLGGWELLFPSADPGVQPVDWFPRHRDRELFAQLGLPPPPPSPLVPLPHASLLVSDGLLGHLAGRDRLAALNASATRILLRHREGASTDSIAGELAEGVTEPPPFQERRRAVETTLAQIRALDSPDPWHQPEDHADAVPLAESEVVARRTYALGPTVLQVRFGRTRFLPPVEAVLRHLEVPDTGTPHETIDVVALGSAACVLSHGEHIRVGRLSRLAAALHSALLHRACAAPGVVAAFHAGAVVRGGRSLVLPGRSGSGKTTLTAALAAGGFSYLSDEAAILDADYRVRPAPVALGLTPEALPLLATRLAAFAPPISRQRRDRTPVEFLPLARFHATAAPVAALVFPRLEAGASATLRPLGPARTLQRLSHTGTDLPRPFTREEALTLLHWLNRVPSFVLHYHSLDEATALLTRWMDETPAPA